MISEHDILRQFELWNTSIRTGNPEKVLKLYAPEAILTPSFSDVVRHNPEQIREYFRVFLRKKPRAQMDEVNTRLCGDCAVNSGIYTFRFAAGSVGSVQARFTFVYRVGDSGVWPIIAHHSSALPMQYKQWFESESDLLGM